MNATVSAGVSFRHGGEASDVAGEQRELFHSARAVERRRDRQLLRDLIRQECLEERALLDVQDDVPQEPDAVHADRTREQHHGSEEDRLVGLRG